MQSDFLLTLNRLFPGFNQSTPLSHFKKNSFIPFKNHGQFSILFDMLSRKDQHHIILHVPFPHPFKRLYFQAFLQFLTENSASARFCDAHFIELNLPCTKNESVEERKMLEEDFRDLHTPLLSNENYIFFLLPDEYFSNEYTRHQERGLIWEQIKALFTHHQCRFLQMSSELPNNKSIPEQFHILRINPLGEIEQEDILKYYRNEYENYHDVIIPEELLLHAFHLSQRYLSPDDALQKTLFLLESSAARISQREHFDNNPPLFKPVLNANHLTDVLSTWTGITTNQLQLNKFKMKEFTENLAQKLPGQETIIKLITEVIQQAHMSFQKKTGPFCSFLLAGSKYCGKKTLAFTLAEQLFNQPHALYFAHVLRGGHSLTHTKFERSIDKKYVPLKEIINECPFAIFLFEHIEQAELSILNEINDILGTGYFIDENGQQYNFTQAIFLFSTTLCAKELADMCTAENSDRDENHHMELIKLVMRDDKIEKTPIYHDYSPEELVLEITSKLSHHLGEFFIQHVNIIPFLPLGKGALEKIIRSKLRTLGKMLEANFDIELSYAPEVIRYLTNEVFAQREQETQAINVDGTLVPFQLMIEQAVLHRDHSLFNNRERPNQLFLQLNETGKSLRFDWLSTTHTQKQN